MSLRSILAIFMMAITFFLWPKPSYAQEFYLPVVGYEITAGWYYSADNLHYGVDYDGTNCSTPVLAAASGTISYVFNTGCSASNADGGWGCNIEIEHSNGYASKYSHLCEGSAEVSTGQTVNAGQIIAYVGYTGNVQSTNGDGSHLDFRIQPPSCSSWWSSCLVDPYDINSTGGYYPDINTTASCGSNHLWTQCPPVAADGSSSSNSTSRSSIITTERTTVFSTYNVRNQRKNACTGIKEPPNFMLSTVTDSLHWWNYSGSGDPNPSGYTRDTGKYETLLVENYTGSCDGVIVYDEWGGANRAYTVQCQQWTGWRTRNGPEGAPTQSYPKDCGAPITNVYGKGGKWVQDFQDCIIVYDPDDGSCESKTTTLVKAYPHEFAPGEMANGTWNTVVSYQFAERYERGGASKRFGYPIMGVSSANGVSYQIFQKGSRQRTFYDDGQTIKIVSTAWFQSHIAGSLTLSQLATYADEEDIEIDEENDDETDADNDTWTVADGDCNDLSNGVHPDHEELNDGVDNDCDDEIDEDLDNDGYTEADGDCNDLSNGVYPGHFEDVDSVDNNCDGLIDNDPYPDILVYYPPLGGWWTARNDEGDTLTYYTNLFQGMFTQGATEDWYRFPPETCDINGDFFTDIIVYSPAGEWTVIESDEDTLPASTSLWATSYGTDSSGAYYEAHCGDFDGDGLDDGLLYALHGGYYVRLSNGSSFQWSPDDWMEGCNCGAQASLNEDFTLLVGDFTGDDLEDVLLYEWDAGTWYVGTSTGTSFSLTTWYTNFGGLGYHPLIGDLNGDGLDDIAIMSEVDGHWNTLLSTGTSFDHQAIWINQHGGTGYQPFLKDMNGDGLADAVIYEPVLGSWSIALSTGSSFSTPSAWITDFGTDATGSYGVIPFITNTHR